MALTFTPNEEKVAHAILDRFEAGHMAVRECHVLADAGAPRGSSPMRLPASRGFP